MQRPDDKAAEQLANIGTRDHSATTEYRIFGPPGTGKTTNVARQVRRAVDRFGTDSVLVTSFSRAAAAELAGRDVPLKSSQIGTLHSHAYHALGRPEIAEVNAEGWNVENPRLKIKPVSRQTRIDGEDAIEDDDRLHAGDRLLQAMNRYRGLMLPLEQWPQEVREFREKWDRHNRANGLLDFCDLIDVAQRDVRIAPGNPSVIVVDEAQDLNRMQLTLVRQWGRNTEYLLLAGDDDQTIYAWAGASPDAILDPDVPEDHKIFLQQSARVPRSVHAIAERLIQQVGRRQKKSYLPRPADGEVHRLSFGGYRSPEYMILKTAERHLKEGKSIMFLASCAYMLQPLLTVLRKNGIPFHNPYRTSNGFWNPLRLSSRRSAARRILALLAALQCSGEGNRGWTNSDLMLWTEWLRPGILQRDHKNTLAVVMAKDQVTPVTVQRILEEPAYVTLMTALNRGPNALLCWWKDHLAPEFQNRIQFPADVARMRGHEVLGSTPKVVVGTIHSVKGGQADVVYLFPDLSRAGDARYQQRGPSRDSVIRTFYVGATRARETLYLCSAESARAVRI